MKQAVLVAALVALAASLAAADEVNLTNGRKIQGIVSTDTKMPGKVIVEVGAGTIVLDEKDVSSRSEGQTALHEYKERAGRLESSSSAGDLYDLAKWAKENKCWKHVRPLCEKAVALDPDHAGARKELGQKKVGDQWMTFEEEMAAKGMVLFEGAWITPAEKETIEMRRLEAQARRQAEREERERKKEEARQRRQDVINEYLAYWESMTTFPYGYLHQPSWFWPAYYRPYPYLPYRHKLPPGGYRGYGDGYVNAADFVNLSRFRFRR
jgi:hypothetical protein